MTALRLHAPHLPGLKWGPQNLQTCTDQLHPIYIQVSPPSFSIPFLFFSSASLPFWLRSSVVSVLISLISDTGLRTRLLIILIFALRRTSLWACPWSSATVSLVLHCLQVMRIVGIFFHCTLGPGSGCEEFRLGLVWQSLEMGWSWLAVMSRKMREASPSCAILTELRLLPVGGDVAKAHEPPKSVALVLMVIAGENPDPLPSPRDAGCLFLMSDCLYLL